MSVIVRDKRQEGFCNLLMGYGVEHSHWGRGDGEIRNRAIEADLL